MFSHRCAALSALALGAVIVFPVRMASAQSLTPDRGDALAAPPDAPAPTYPWTEQTHADEPPADALSAIGPASPHGLPPSGVAGRLAGWVATVDDNGDLPFMIVDKLGARVFAFDATGKFLGSAPVLVGLARGDDSAPGIGNLKLSQISADERTTPAGRFVAGFGDSDGHGTMLWVDARDAISLHPVMSVNAGERRFERIKSTDPDQHRISYGCINVPKAFYDGVVLTALGSGDAVVYVLPDTKAIGDVFPAFAATLVAGQGGGGPPDDVSGANRVADEPLGIGEPAPARADPVNDPSPALAGRRLAVGIASQ